MPLYFITFVFLSTSKKHHHRNLVQRLMNHYLNEFKETIKFAATISGVIYCPNLFFSFAIDIPYLVKVICIVYAFNGKNF